jgi:hypothetical protein
MFYWFRKAAKLLVTVMLVSFLSIWTTGYIVNSYMESLLKQLNLPLETQPFALSGIWGTLWGADHTASAEKPEVKPSAATGSPASENSPFPSQAASPEPQASVSPSPSTDPDSIPVFNGAAGMLQMTEEQRQQLNAIISKLNAEQLSRLSALLDNGLTEQELKEAGEMLKPALSEEEHGQMMEWLQIKAGGPPSASEEPSASPSPELQIP